MDLRSVRANLEQVGRLLIFVEELHDGNHLRQKLMKVVEEVLQESLQSVKGSDREPVTTAPASEPPPSPILRRSSITSIAGFCNNSLPASLPPLHPESMLSAAERGQLTPIPPPVDIPQQPLIRSSMSVVSRSTSGRMSSRYNDFLAAILPLVRRTFHANNHKDNFKVAGQLWTEHKHLGEYAVILRSAREKLLKISAESETQGAPRTLELPIAIRGTAPFSLPTIHSPA